MRSPAVPLVWEIFRRGRGAVAAIAGATALSWLIDFAERGNPPGRTPTTHNQMLGLLSFLVLFGMFSYVEPTGDRGMGRFPRRHFTLPVSTLQLVAVPVVAGIIAIELLYLLWMGRLAGPEPKNPLFVAVLLGAFMVFYQAVLWTLERIGPLRLVVLGALGIAFFWIGFLPSMGGGAAAWRSPSVLGGVIAVLGAGEFLLVWRYVARIRSGAEGRTWGLGAMIRRLADVLPRRRDAFRSPRAAHFWFEWRCTGSGYPALVAGALVFLVGPMSFLIAGDPASTARVLAGALALPIVLAVPAGLAFSKPLFWSEEMSLPSFVSVRPLSDAELIATKLRVAAVSAMLAWLLVLLFLSAWLSLWASPASVQLLFSRLRVMSDGRWPVVAVLVVSSAVFLSWRFLVAGLWAGMSGSRALFMSWLAPIGVVIVASAVFDLSALPRWLRADLGRLTPFLAAGVLAVAVKLWLAVRGRRWTPVRSMGWYGAAWIAGVASLIALGAVVLSDAGGNLPTGDVQRLRLAVILLAVLAMPLARVMWAPRFLARNRHRR